MNKKILGMQVTGVLVAVAILTLPAFAATIGAVANVDISGIPVSVATSASLKAARSKDHGDDAINARIKSLSDLDARIQSMTKVTADDKSGLESMVQSQITGLAALRTKIDGDTDVTAVRTDDVSITQAFRIYLLVLPKGRIMAASDRALQIGESFSTLSAKLDARISTAQAAGNNTTALNASLADLNTKVTDSNLKANSAISLVVGLSPDNGNAATAASNLVAITAAKSDIAAANSDLKAAYADAKSIVAGLKKFHISTSTEVTVSPTATQ